MDYSFRSTGLEHMNYMQAQAQVLPFRETEVAPEEVSGDFRAFLRQDLEMRMQRNRRYSLRAYAQNLGINSGTLSQILSGKRKVTGRCIERLAPRAGLNPEQIAEFKAKCATQEAASGRWPDLRIGLTLAVAETELSTLQQRLQEIAHRLESEFPTNGDGEVRSCRVNLSLAAGRPLVSASTSEAMQTAPTLTTMN